MKLGIVAGPLPSTEFDRELKLPEPCLTPQLFPPTRNRLLVQRPTSAEKSWATKARVLRLPQTPVRHVATEPVAVESRSVKGYLPKLIRVSLPLAPLLQKRGKPNEPKRRPDVEDAVRIESRGSAGSSETLRTTLLKSRTGRTSTSAVSFGFFAPTGLELRDSPCASSMFGGGTRQLVQ